MKVAFVGLGNMGLPMAKNLVAAGFEVSGYDLSTAVQEQAVAAGVPISTSAGAAAKTADVVITMLPASKHVDELYAGPNGFLSTLPPGKLLIDCSTIAAATARRLGSLAEKAKFGFIDAPVSGGTAGAAAGTLTFMVGGSAADLEKARPVLSKMGTNICHAGPAGAGQIAKACNNMLLAIQMIGTAEALNVGIASGLDATVLSDIMRRSSGGNWVLEKYNPVPGVLPGVPASRDYSGGFGTALMLKDLGLAQENAAAVHLATPLGTLARDLYATHHDAGFGTCDFSSIIKTVKSLSGGDK